MPRKHPKEIYPCNVCPHILHSYEEYESHRAYFHEKDVEKELNPKCPKCGGEMHAYGCKSCGYDELLDHAFEKHVSSNMILRF